MSIWTEIPKFVDRRIAEALKRWKVPRSQGGTGTIDGSATPRGAASGDLDGTFPGPKVVGIQTRPVVATAPDDGDVLRWNSDLAHWEPGASDTGPVGPGGGALLVSTAAATAVWAYPLTTAEGGWLMTDDGRPMYIEATP